MVTATALPGVSKLPVSSTIGLVSVEEALRVRRSIRELAPTPLPLADLAQLLWAAQGVTAGDGRRTAPSAGALYPLDVYAVAGDVETLPPGVYRYEPGPHRLEAIIGGDRRMALARAAAEQDFVAEAPAAIVLAAHFARTFAKYGERASQYVAIEAGCAAQNIALQAVALRLASVIVGAFDEAKVCEATSIPRGETPLIIMPVGIQREPESGGSYGPRHQHSA